MSMIAVVFNPACPELPCIVSRTARSGFGVIAETYCADKRNAAQGVDQVPDNTKCCPVCMAAVETKRRANSGAKPEA